MMDVIVCWPRFADYPRWRQFIRDERHRFGRVWVVFTEHDGLDRSGWVRANFPDVDFIDSPDRAGRDWRDVAVNAALDRSEADRVWFTEQDFTVTDSSFWRVTGPVVGIGEDGGRALHPACIFADRALVERTSRYFGPEPVDHFGRFADELLAMGPADLVTSGYRHEQANSESQYLVGIGQEPRFHPENFRLWVADQLAAEVPLEPGWEGRMRSWLG